MAADVRARVEDVAQTVHTSRTFRHAARLGLAARAVFYLILAFLAGHILVTGVSAGRQANAHGALTAVASTPPGMAVLALAAIGFLAFGLSRELGAWRDRDTGTFRRLTTAGQGLFYLALAVGTTSFLFGRHATGSEQQHEHTTGRLLGLPGGRVIVIGVGLVVLGVCLWQIRMATTDDFADGLHTERMSRPVWLLVRGAAHVGIAARAATFVPMGVFLIVAAVTYDPNRAKGLDVILQELAQRTWGTAVLALVVVGFIVFAVYSGLEATYKDVEAGA